ncbi:hypothetical protein D3C81_1634150 [compost metagenome]
MKAVDGGHGAGLMLPLGVDLEACVTLGWIFSDALCECLQSSDIDTVEMLVHFQILLKSWIKDQNCDAPEGDHSVSANSL